MKQEFVTLRGKVEIQDGVIRIKNRKPKHREDIFFLAFFSYYFLTQLADDSKAKPLAYICLAFLGIYALIILIEALFFIAWRNKIRISEIKSVKTLNDEYGGLEVIVQLNLRNGRNKKSISVFSRNSTKHSWNRSASKYPSRIRDNSCC